MSSQFSVHLKLLTVASTALVLASLATVASTLRAGVGRVNLTPPLEMKAALGGYGARLSKPAIGEHDAIWAKALVLAQDERKFVRSWEKLRPAAVGAFEYHTETIALPQRQPHADFMKTGGAEYGLNPATMKDFLERLVPAQTHSTSLRLGDLVILGVPGEMAAQLGLEAKSTVAQMTGASSVTIGGLADEWISYILPAEEYRKGGYEASMSFYGETLGNTIVEGIIKCAGELK